MSRARTESNDIFSPLDGERSIQSPLRSATRHLLSPRLRELV